MSSPSLQNTQIRRTNVTEKKTCSLVTHFSTIPDFRVNRRKLHKLIDIMVIAVCAVIC
ncbi:MAG: transposase family protein, partial [Candidatus Electrothrix sp. MAN1_4]|nr:transposase family protein [Candidatus Electrothrix sp. MAN1_4]